MMDDEGNSQQETARSFLLVMSQGEHRSGDLGAGLAILMDIGLVVQEGDRLIPKTALLLLAGLSDADALRHLRRVCAEQVDSLARVQSGVAGETAIVEACRVELSSLGRPDLAAKVTQLSVLDDTLGYDVSAPTLTERVRLLEVKTTTHPSEAIFTFFLSRNEFDVGRRERSWSLVACEASGDAASVIGWCRASALVPYLPEDHHGRWTEAFIRLPRSVLLEGIPPAV